MHSIYYSAIFVFFCFFLIKYLAAKLDGWICISDLRKQGVPIREMSEAESEAVSCLIHPITQANEERARLIRPESNNVYLIEGKFKASQIAPTKEFESCVLGKYPVNVHRSLWISLQEENSAEVVLSKRSATILKLNGREIGDISGYVKSESPCRADWNIKKFINIGIFYSVLLLILSIHLLVASVFSARLLPGWSVACLIIMMAVGIFALMLGWRDRGVTVSLVGGGVRYFDKATGYFRDEYIPAMEIKSIKVRRGLLFKSLVINIKDSNQRYFLCNALIGRDFIQAANDLIQTHNS